MAHQTHIIRFFLSLFIVYRFKLKFYNHLEFGGNKKKIMQNCWNWQKTVSVIYGKTQVNAKTDTFTKMKSVLHFIRFYSIRIIHHSFCNSTAPFHYLIPLFSWYTTVGHNPSFPHKENNPTNICCIHALDQEKHINVTLKKKKQNFWECVPKNLLKTCFVRYS